MNVGDVAEAAFIYQAALRGFEVFLPTSHNTKADIIIRKACEPPIMVQVKKATKQKHEKPHHKERWKIIIGSGKPSSMRRVNKTGKPRYTLYQEGDFDIIAVYIAEHDSWALYPLTEILGPASLSWNLIDSPKNNWEIIDKKS